MPLPWGVILKRCELEMARETNSNIKSLSVAIVVVIVRTRVRVLVVIIGLQRTKGASFCILS